MISAAALWLLLVSAVCFVASALLSDAARRAGIGSRFVWLAGMAAPFALAAAEVWSGASTPSTLSVAVDVVPLPPLIIGPAAGGALPGLETVMAGAWGLSSLAFLVVLVGAQRRLTREGRDWVCVSLLGRQVRVSSRRGPAVAGLLRPAIVLPDWSLRLPAPDQELILQHEEEHLRARDPLLRLGALLLVAVAPWNPVVWMQLRALMTAVEIDCDRRVLRRSPDPQRYGDSLITVAARVGSPTLALSGFAERPHALERRIRAMTDRTSRFTPLRVALSLAAGLLVGLQACSVDAPTQSGESPSVEAPAEDTPAAATETVEIPPPGDAADDPAARMDGEAPEAEALDVDNAPVFDVAPALQNRSVVVQAMQDEYPPLLRDAGVGGTVRVWAFIDETGTLTDIRIDETSGHQALDDAALRVGMTMEFSAATRQGSPVGAWVALPITFQPN